MKVLMGAVPFLWVNKLQTGQEVLCECGKLPKVKAKACWIKKLEDQITRVGFSMVI
jgi:hypothetical protein